MTEQEQLAADILGQVVTIGDEPVPSAFEDFVRESIARRPSPAPPVEPPTLAEINDKLDEILSLLRGGET